MTRLLATALTVLLLGLLPARAESPKEISWEDLVPPGPPLVNPLGHLSNNQQVELEILYDIRRAFELGFITEVDDRYEDGVELAHKLENEDGLDVDGLLAEFAALHQEILRRNSLVNSELDGELVRLPGYVLPLEFTDAAIDEMLLVPYVGACIHVPPPPPNQIVFVELEQSYLPEGLYAPVWITGRLKAQQSTNALFFVDGEADIDTGYRLEGIRVEPYLY